MTFPGLVRANNLNDIVDQEKAWDNLGDGIATGDISIATPSLDLNFAANKSLVDDISGNNLITFSRASTGTFVGSNGLIQTAASGVPRFDHNPATGESLGLLVEGARTNLITYSEQFDDAAWTKNNVTVTANAAVAPDGASTADKIVANTGAASWYSLQALGTSPSTSSCSVYAKAAGWNYVSVGRGFVFGGGDYAIFDLQTGAVSRVPTYPGSTASIVSVGNGWYRCTLLSPQTDNNFHVTPQGVGTSVNGGTPNSTNGVHIWGAQLEAGSFPTSYIPTVASTVTRAADVASITGANFSSWYNASRGGGTIFSEYRNPLTGIVNPGHIWSFNGGGVRWLAYWGPFQLYDGTTGFGLNPSNLLTSPVSEAVALEAVSSGVNQESVARNGIVTSGGGPGQIIGLNTFSIGLTTNVNSYLNGTIARLAYWPSRLNDKLLQYITQPSINTINLYSFSYSVTGKEVLALNSVRNTSTRDFIFIKGLLSSVQPRLNTASQNTSSGVLLDSFAMPKLAPTTSGNYFFSSGVTLSGVTTRINGTNALSIATSPFSGSTATAPLLFRELRPQANWRITEPMPSGTIASPSLAIPFETNDFVLFMKAGQN